MTTTIAWPGHFFHPGNPIDFLIWLPYPGIGELEVEMRPVRIEVNDVMQQGYIYLLTEPAGQNFHLEFRPDLTPKQMLELGVFGGKYMTDCVAEYPADWFEKARLCPERHDPELNCF